jgi:hypothetical protein
VRYYTYWALRAKALVNLESKKLNGFWAVGLCVPIAFLLMMLGKKLFGFEELEKVE